MQTMVSEGDEDMLATIENLRYLLDDTKLSTKGSKWNRTSEELAGQFFPVYMSVYQRCKLFRNSKKFEEAGTIHGCIEQTFKC